MGIKYLYKINYKNGDSVEHYNLMFLTAYMNELNKKNNFNHIVSLNSIKNIVLNRNKPEYIETIEKHNFKDYFNIKSNDRRPIETIYNTLHFTNKLKNELSKIS